MREEVNNRITTEAAAMLLGTVEGLTSTDLIDYVYGISDEDTAQYIERARTNSPELDAFLREIESQETAQREPAAINRNEQRKEIVLASIKGPEALRQLLTQDREPWFHDAIQKAIAQIEEPTVRETEPQPRRAIAWTTGLAFAAILVLVAFLWTVLRPAAPGAIADGHTPQPPKNQGPNRSPNRSNQPVPKPEAPPVRNPGSNGDPVVRSAPKPSTPRLPVKPVIESWVAVLVERYEELPAVLSFRGSGTERPRSVELARPDFGDFTLDSLQPRFAWKSPKAQARLDRIAIDGSTVESVTLRSVTDGLAVTPVTPLKPGSLYRLTLAPDSPDLSEETAFVFHAPSADDLKNIHWADRNARRFGKESAMLYFLAGQYGKAVNTANRVPGAFTDAKSRAWRDRFGRFLKLRRDDPSQTEIP